MAMDNEEVVCMNRLLLNGKLKLISHNIRSINKNFDALKISLSQYDSKFDVICAQEVWSLSQSTKYSIDGYLQPIGQTRRDKKGGGVLLWVNNKWTCEVLKDIGIFCEGEYESAAVRISIGKLEYIIINIYRPPSGNCLAFIDQLQKQVKEARTKCKKVIVVGDININLADKNWISNIYRTAIANMGMEQVIEGVSRRCKSRESLIDHIICSPLFRFKAGIVNTEIADHYGTYLIITGNSGNKTQTNTKTTFMSHKIEKLDALRSKIAGINWHTWWEEVHQSDLDVIVNNFSKIIDESIKDTCEVVVRSNTNNKENSVWMNKCLMWERGALQKLRNKFNKNKTNTNEYNYKAAKRIYNRKIKEAKSEYYLSKLTAAHGDSRKTWQILNEIMGIIMKTQQ
jgi:hypothetical protein